MISDNKVSNQPTKYNWLQGVNSFFHRVPEGEAQILNFFNFKNTDGDLYVSGVFSLVDAISVSVSAT